MNTGDENSADVSWVCRYCGGSHKGVICPRVKAIEYYPDGNKKRLEFLTPADMTAPVAVPGLVPTGNPFVPFWPQTTCADPAQQVNAFPAKKEGQ